MKKSRTKPTKPKTKRKASPPDLTGGRKRITRFQPGVSGNPDAQFKPGISGNPAGRPLGARSKLTDAFVAAVAAEFDRRGTDCLRQLEALAFVQVALALVPRNAKLDIETAQKPVYWISDMPHTAEEWIAKWGEPVEDAGLKILKVK